MSSGLHGVRVRNRSANRTAGATGKRCAGKYEMSGEGEAKADGEGVFNR